MYSVVFHLDDEVKQLFLKKIRLPPKMQRDVTYLWFIV